MKKFLSVAVAFGMVAGVAATASALELKVKGVYKVDGYWLSPGMIEFTEEVTNPDTGVVTTEKTGDTHPHVFENATLGEGVDDDWYQHTMKVNADLIVNDMITLKSDIRFVDSNTVWGGGTMGAGSYDDGNQFDINKMWLVYKSPIGKFEIGRRPGGAWGPDFVSSSTYADRIFWHLPTGDGPVKAYTFLQKSKENDKAAAVESDGPLVSGFNGADSDYYEIGVGYKTDPVTVYGGIGTAQNDASGQEMVRFKTWGKIAAGPGAVVWETDWKTGAQNNTVDYDSYAAMLAYAGTSGNVSFLAGYATITGDSNSTDGDNNAYDAAHGTGDDFEPLYILTGNRTNVLNGDVGGSNPVRQAGVHALVATADYKVSEDMTLHGGLGWGIADDEPAGWSDDYGWEADLGMAYKLYQNLTYELHFGYWFVGDFADLGGTASTEDMMLLSHHLTMKF